MSAHQEFSTETREFTVHPRFNVAVVIAQARSIIGKAFDKEAKEDVAVKVHYELDQHLWRAIMALRDIKFMTALRHENIMAVKNVIGHKKHQILKSILLHMELMDDDLYYFVIHHPSSPQVNQIKQWTFQLMNGLHYLHSAGIVHRDFKPNNILVKQSGNLLKIADFDHTRKLGTEPPNNLTNQVTSYEVQAPESAVANTRYSFPIDVWALGCIFYFLFKKTLLFPSRSQNDVLENITSVFGKLTEQDVEGVANAQARQWLLEMEHKERVNWRNMLPEEAPESASDLLGKMLEFSERRRIELTNALYHEFLDGVRPPGWVPPMYTGPEILHYSLDLPYDIVHNHLRESITLDLDDPELENALHY